MLIQNQRMQLQDFRSIMKPRAHAYSETSARKALAKSNPALRTATADALATLGNGQAILELQKAIANEKDDVVRAQLRESQERLQKKAPH